MIDIPANSVTAKLSEMKNDYLAHYGTPRHSGRYPWGSGDNPYQHEGFYSGKPQNISPTGWGTVETPFDTYSDLYSAVVAKKAAGQSIADIAKDFSMTTKELNLQYRMASHKVREEKVAEAEEMRKKGMTLRDIGDKMGINESSVRSLLDKDSPFAQTKEYAIAEYLKQEIASKGMLDVGKGTENILTDILGEGKTISKDKLEEGLRILEMEGYHIYPMGISTGPKQQSNTIILTDKTYGHKDVYDRQGDIQTIGEYRSPENNKVAKELRYPSSLDSSRVFIRYADDPVKSGNEYDGTMFIRPGVPDLSLGNSHYAQVRIMVDNSHYLKGMALYSDDIPEGYDIVFNTNKRSSTPPKEVFKKIKKDPKNPFGAYITAEGQSDYIDPETGEVKLSPINKIKEEGAWNDMSKNLASQFLGKQKVELAKRQLDITYDNMEAEYKEIMDISNPTLKKYYLQEFARKCDSKAVDLKAAALPRQLTQVLLPVDSLRNNEVYAPNFENGEEVVLVRYPHGGIFEMPRLKVNNNNASAKKTLGNVKDAVGINSAVAAVLSGADFDGDQVVVIPTKGFDIRNKKPLKGLEGFDDKISYSTSDKRKAFEQKYPDADDWKEKDYISKFYKETGIKLMSKDYTNKQMGIVSNLIMDMTLQGANDDELARAVRHSMVVIDANKHKLDYKQSEKDNDIQGLINKYQPNEGRKAGGAHTLLTKVSKEIDIPERQGSGRIDPETGEMIFKNSGRTYYDKKTGKYKEATQKTKLGSVTKDMRELSSGTMIEDTYANFGNKCKALANRARKEYLITQVPTRDTKAVTEYADEVASLKSKLNTAKKNKPLERRANAIANQVVANAKKADVEENLTTKELKKIRQVALNDARIKTGAVSQHFNITDREWEAIQKNAISSTVLTEILRYVDADDLRSRSLPNNVGISTSKINRIKALASIGYTQADIATQLGVSTSTVNKYI